MILGTGPQLGSVERYPSHAVASGPSYTSSGVSQTVLHNIYYVRIKNSSNGKLFCLNCPEVAVLMQAKYPQLCMQHVQLNIPF